MTTTKTLPSPSLRGNFVFLRAGDLRLLLPQEEVGAADYLEARPQAGPEYGLLGIDDDERAFAALSSRMTLLPQCPDERFVVTTLGDDAVMWCWDELKVLIGIELHPQPLPAVLAAPDTPVDHHVQYDGQTAFLCDARRLQEFALARRS